MDNNKSYDVIIAGAGPVGLFLACELGTAGVSVLVLEQDATPDSPWKVGLHGSRGLHIHSVEAFHRRGMLEKVLTKMKPPGHIEQIPGFDLHFAAHFASIRLDAKKADFTRWKYHLPLPGPLFYPAPTSLEQLETTFAERAQSLGVHITRGRGVTRVSEEGENVKVWAGEENECFTAQYVVGCDGEDSTVRKVGGFEFPGTPAEFTGYVVHCDLKNPEVLQRGFCRTKTGMYIFPAPGHLYVVDFETLGFDQTSEVITREYFQEVLQRVSETDAVVENLHLASSMTNNLKQTTEYRRGRVLLAGDSAHIHPSFGAQGLSTGIGDAVNLGWKLAATIKGFAAKSPDLLDTYQDERHPEGARVLEWARAQLSLLRPSLYSQATAKILKDLINTEQGTTYFVEHILGLARLYDLGDAQADPIVGYSTPDFEFADGLRLGTKLERGNFLLIDFGSIPSASVGKYIKSLDPVVTYIGSHAKETYGLKALLVRPDGVVAWASASTDEISLDEVKTALSRWLNLSELEVQRGLQASQASQESIADLSFDEKIADLSLETPLVGLVTS